MKKQLQSFRLNPSWSLSRENGGIAVSGGEDSLYYLDCPEPLATFLVSPPASFTREAMPDGSEVVFTQLLSADVITPVRKTKRTATLRVGIVSDSKPVSDELQQHFDTRKFITNSSSLDVLVLTRTHTSFENFLKKVNYASITTPHIFVDMAFQHTISLGPLVFPGDTPCIACLEGRLKTRWGDRTPPKEPTAKTMYSNLAAELACLELDRFKANDMSLTFKTVAYDISARTTTINKLLTVPQCPYCSSDIAYASGKLLYNTSQ